jgi:hypothetical protein
MSLVRGFLGNTKDENCPVIVQSLLHNYQNLGCLMSLKIHFLLLILIIFPYKLGAVSVKQVERFDQGKAKIEQPGIKKGGIRLRWAITVCLSVEKLKLLFLVYSELMTGAASSSKTLLFN